MGEQPYIFLSYRSLEKDFALKLAADLKNMGLSVWMDRLESGIKVGDNWRDTIQEAVNNCKAMIANISPDYVVSQICRDELSRAHRLDHPIFPILLKDVAKLDWPMEVERLQYIDFRDWQDTAIYSERLEELVAVIRTKAVFGFITPSPETQYLTSLIAKLKAHQGVLEYVELEAETNDLRILGFDPDKIWNPEFVFLLVPQNESQKSKHIHLNSLSEVQDKYPRCVLIGEPGAGKSTGVRRLVLEVAQKRLDNPHIAPLPIYLYLPEWTTDPTPLEFITAKFPFKTDDFVRMLTSGEISLFLDGLNELGAEGPSRAAQLKIWLNSEQAPKFVIVTCRAGDYSIPGLLELGLPIVEVRAMENTHIEKFVANYIGERADQFLKQLSFDNVSDQAGNRQLIHLARNPYMLAALIYLFIQIPEGELPRNTGTLFRRLVRALWEREPVQAIAGLGSTRTNGRYVCKACLFNH